MLESSSKRFIQAQLLKKGFLHLLCWCVCCDPDMRWSWNEVDLAEVEKENLLLLEEGYLVLMEEQYLLRLQEKHFLLEEGKRRSLEYSARRT
jgi:hypothetical protein